MLLPKDGRDLVPFWLIGSCLLFSSNPSFVCGVSIWLEEFFSPVMKKVFIPSTKHKMYFHTKLYIHDLSYQGILLLPLRSNPPLETDKCSH